MCVLNQSQSVQLFPIFIEFSIKSIYLCLASTVIFTDNGFICNSVSLRIGMNLFIPPELLHLSLKVTNDIGMYVAITINQLANTLLPTFNLKLSF